MSSPRQPIEAINPQDELQIQALVGAQEKADVRSSASQEQGGTAVSLDGTEDAHSLDLDQQDNVNMKLPSAGTTTAEHSEEVVRSVDGHGDQPHAPQEETGNIYDHMESSTATLKPDPAPYMKASTPQHLSPEDGIYLDPTPKTPASSQPPSRSASSAAGIPHVRRADGSERSPTRSDAGFDEKASASEDERENNSRSEIQSIMDQFSEEGQGPGHEEVMSPRLEFAGPLLGSPIQHPPRKSSLEPLNSGSGSATQSMQDLRISSHPSTNHPGRDPSDIGPAVPPKAGSIRGLGQSRGVEDRLQGVDSPMSPPLHRPPPPEPEPEPDLPFDFHRFLEQLRHRTADPVAKFLRSFLQEFGKRQWMVHEQVKIIGDFLAFITNKMAQCEVWREVSDAEFDNAREGMEKLVMNRLYTQTFSPAIPPPQPLPGSKGKRRGGERQMGPGRKGQHQEDVERDEILAQKVSIYGWIREEHLDIPPVADSGKRFLLLAQQGKLLKSKFDYDLLTLPTELLKIKTYRAPRDKIICVLNCCKVIFGRTYEVFSSVITNYAQDFSNIPKRTRPLIPLCLS